MKRKVQGFGLNLLAAGLLACSVIMFMGTLGTGAIGQDDSTTDPVPDPTVAVKVGDCVDSTTGKSVPPIPDNTHDCSKSTFCYPNAPCPQNGTVDTTAPFKIGACTAPKTFLGGCAYCPTPGPGGTVTILCGYTRSWTQANCKGTATQTPIYSNGRNECQ